jgi:pimeloyl-ACP methyl ester carboxylesterase
MRVRLATVSVVLVVSALPAAAQRLSDFITPRPLPRGGVLIVGFLGGFEHWDDQHRGVRKVALDLRSKGFFAETAGNHSRRTALEFIRRALDANGDGRIDPEEAAVARVILYGQSWGGAAVVKTARDLERWGVPVLLTVQVDSVGAHDAVIPANVRAAANFFQHDLFTIQGKTGIRAADPSRTRILGNFQFSYYFHPVDESEASWARRKLGGSHATMELDPAVWQQVERLILTAIP